MKSTSNNKGLIVLALLVVAGGGAATYWMSTVASSAREQVNKLRATTPSESEVKKQLAESDQKVAQYLFELEHLEMGVPSIAYVPTLLTELEQLGKANELEVIGVRPVLDAEQKQTKREGEKSLSKQDKAYEEINIDFIGRGSYGHVLQTVNALQKFPKIIAVKTISITPKREVNNLAAKPNLEAVVRVKAFVFADKKAKASKSSGEPQNS
ncbi:MAG: type 4a pilus biogenesis protein PilO [Fimbriimonadaceae bacterium]